MESEDDMLLHLTSSKDPERRAVGRLIATGAISNIMKWIGEERKRPEASPKTTYFGLINVMGMILGYAAYQLGKDKKTNSLVEKTLPTLGNIAKAAILAQSNLMEEIVKEAATKFDIPEDKAREVARRIGVLKEEKKG